MPKRGTPPLNGEVLQGTLDFLILQTLVLGPAHGHTIAHVIERRSDDVLQVEHGSLYPALHRLEDRALLPAYSERAKAARGADQPMGRIGSCNRARAETGCGLTCELHGYETGGFAPPERI
jgi:Transcriptional regulator PadR-like family